MQVAPVRDLLLVGGGHAHVQVLRRFGMEPVPGVRLTLIAREPHTPYSGMLPGYVAGRYDYDDIHIDLGPLARFANARFIADSVEGMDLEQRQVTLANHPQLRFDAVSLNIGATPKALAAGAVATTVKPIGQFLPKWRESLSSLADADRILLLGAGAGAVELAIAMRAVVPATVGIGLVGDTLLPGWNERARKRVREVLAKHKVGLMESERVVSIEGDTALTQSGQQLLAEHFFDVTGVQSPEWLKQTGLLLDDQGFVRVDGHLRSLSHPQLFAAGDIAHLEGQERPKSGVFAVRAGPVLAKNLARLWSNQPLVRYRAQRHGLALLGTGDNQALGARGAVTIQGAWVERLKEWIDRRFMRRFQVLPQMPPAALPEHLQETVAAEIPDPMRCGGCGGKLGAQPLTRALARLPLQQHADLMLGMGDDAAHLRISGSAAAEVLLTVDGLSQFVDDPYQFGRIATHHAINDILAMGGKPVAALALATLPVMGEALVEQDLYLLLKGVVEVLAEHDAVLAGGHSAEGPQMALGLTVAGYPGRQLLSKSNLAVGQRLVLSKALGSGMLLAGEMRGQTPSRHLLNALRSMDQSNQRALDLLLAHGATAATDITGFGLLGHLAEMLQSPDLGVDLRLDQLPMFDGVASLLDAEIYSSLQPANRAVLSRYQLCRNGFEPASAGDPQVPPVQRWLELACDPQTSGGLLAALPADRAQDCVQALHDAGYPAAADVAVITPSGWRLRLEPKDEEALS